MREIQSGIYVVEFHCYGVGIILQEIAWNTAERESRPMRRGGAKVAHEEEGGKSDSKRETDEGSKISMFTHSILCRAGV